MTTTFALPLKLLALLVLLLALALVITILLLLHLRDELRLARTQYATLQNQHTALTAEYKRATSLSALVQETQNETNKNLADAANADVDTHVKQLQNPRQPKQTKPRSPSA